MSYGERALQPPTTTTSMAKDIDGLRQDRNHLRNPVSQTLTSHRPLSSLNPSSGTGVSRVASQVASYHPYRRPPSYNRSYTPEPDKDLLRVRREANHGIRLRKEDYTPGLIIRAPLHEQDSRGESGTHGSCSSVASNGSQATLAEKYTTASRFGPIFTKYRKMIVVACHEDNYVAIPLYTHNGKGLVNKARPDEFISVKDHRDKDEDWKRLSTWEPLVTEYVREGIDPYEPKTTAHLAYPVSRSYRLPVVKEGWLEAASAKYMKDLYARFGGIKI